MDQKIQAVVVKNEQEVRRTIEQLDSRAIEDAVQAILGHNASTYFLGAENDCQ